MSLDDRAFDRVSAAPLRAYASANLFAVLPVALIISINSGIEFITQWIVAIVIAALASAFTFRQRSLPKMHSTALYLILTGSMLAATCLSSYLLIGKGTTHSVLFVFKISALIIAVIAPTPSWIGQIIILIFLIAPSLQAISMPQIPRDSDFLEPWITMAYALAALLLLRYQIDSQNSRKTELLANANERSLQDFTDIASAIGDLANTPIQNLDIIIEMLKSESITRPEAADSLKRVSYQLHELTHILYEHQNKILPGAGRESLDSFSILRTKLAHLSTNREKRDL